MVLNVFPLSWMTSPLTFSRKNAFGCFLFSMSATSKKSVPLVSANPKRFPANEKAWQGKPAHKMSKLSGMNFFVDSSVMSPKGTSP